MNAIFFMLLGVAVLLFVKYIVVGLEKWDAFFHPGRIEPSGSPFLKGIFA